MKSVVIIRNPSKVGFFIISHQRLGGFAPQTPRSRFNPYFQLCCNAVYITYAYLGPLRLRHCISGWIEGRSQPIIIVINIKGNHSVWGGVLDCISNPFGVYWTQSLSGHGLNKLIYVTFWLNKSGGFSGLISWYMLRGLGQSPGRCKFFLEYALIRMIFCIFHVCLVI